LSCKNPNGPSIRELPLWNPNEATVDEFSNRVCIKCDGLRSGLDAASASLLLRGGLFGFLVCLLRRLESLCGVFHRLFGEFVPGQVIFFAVMRGSRTVRVCREFVKLRGSLMETLWHGLPFHNIRIRRPRRSGHEISYNWNPALPWPAPARQVLPQRLSRRPVSQAPLRNKPRSRAYLQKHLAMRMPAPRILRSKLTGDPTASNFS